LTLTLDEQQNNLKLNKRVLMKNTGELNRKINVSKKIDKCLLNCNNFYWTWWTKTKWCKDVYKSKSFRIIQSKKLSRANVNSQWAKRPECSYNK